MNKLTTSLGIALLGLSVGLGATSASAGGKKFIDIDVNIGGHNHRPGGHGHPGDVPPQGQLNHFPGQAGHFPGQAGQGSDNGIRCIRAPCKVHVNRGSGKGTKGAADWAREARERNEAVQRHDAAVKKMEADHAAEVAKQNANLKPGEKPIKSTGKLKVTTLGDKQVASCKQQVAIQFVNKSGGVTSVAEAKRREAQCVTMFRD